MLLIVALLLVLAFMMIPSLSLREASARDARRLEDMRRIEAAIGHYRTDHGCFPPAHESLKNFRHFILRFVRRAPFLGCASTLSGTSFC